MTNRVSSEEMYAIKYLDSGWEIPKNFPIDIKKYTQRLKTKRNVDSW